ncbi:ankyrin repeat domain-containing protein [Paraflavitalea sp. CAU 1676]|uniref:ankyrin repeat domain-containing protein n=1 Tax=Paraflavitalea sp. CAU 1676 TaxID=3032598 RepID=UPI0023DC1F9D|nr:ankyrin repeat domain-containing protein [Paraflavitalea sp. CAU 1676]MDF2188039.1 ankyrin repeat domain-containing protein [Paraflavitalea sp. CAU 1676]
MIKPIELSVELPMSIPGGLSTTTKVWEVLEASHAGNLDKVKALAATEPGLLYAQYNYTPPIHFAVREGHLPLTEYLLNQGALDLTYRIYPFLDTLLTIALDRNHHHIAALLQEYLHDDAHVKYRGDHGEIHYNRSEEANAFEQAVDEGRIDEVADLLKGNPALAQDLTFFWSEGILTMPAKDGNYPMIELLMQYGAVVPKVLKWAQFYYLERYEQAAFLLERGMDPNTMSWHHVTVLHDMAQKGELEKAQLLLKHGARLDDIDDEYQSTPLGLAARWGQAEMVELLLDSGADPNKSGAPWSTPLAWANHKGHVHIGNLLRAAGAQS